MSDWLGSTLPATGAAQIFATLVFAVLMLRLLRYVLRLFRLGT